MDFRIKSNDKSVSRWLKTNVGAMVGKAPKALKIAGLEAINIIEDRTASGRETGLIRFKAYSEKYKSFRKSKGRSTKPDLQFSGRMLGSMTSKVGKDKVTIFFTRAEEAKKAAMNEKTRPFFGLNRKDQKHLANVFFKAIK